MIKQCVLYLQQLLLYTWLSVVEDMGVVTVGPVTRGEKSGVHGTVTSGPVSGAKPNREKEGSHHLHHTADPV